MGKKRKTPGINGSSSADIAFMLLLFFLLTTSMDTDQGLARRLPPPPDPTQKNEEQDIKRRNMLSIMVSSDNRIIGAGEEVQINQLKEKVKEFVANPANEEPKQEKEPVKKP